MMNKILVYRNMIKKLSILEPTASEKARKAEKTASPVKHEIMTLRKSVSAIK